MPALHTSRLGTRGRPAESRASILKAAVREFAREGVAGARTEAIARFAGVNKALIYYYFRDKEALYEAVLEEVFRGLRRAIDNALSEKLPPRARLAAYIGAHFDYIASNPPYHRLVHAELLRASREASRLRRVVRQYIRPVYRSLSALLAEGAEAGDFRRVDPLQFIPSMISVIAFYFATAPILKVISGFDPMSSDRLAERRDSVIDFISAALFTPKESAHERA